MFRNTRTSWGAVAKSLHWLLAVAIAGQYVLGKLAENAPVSPRKLDLFVWHKSIGLCILLLVGMRIAWRLANTPPDPVPGTRSWEQGVARAAHALLYLLLVAVPLSGWWVSDTSRIPFKLFWQLPVPDLLAADRAASEAAELVHSSLTTALLILVSLHVLAALRHHFLLHNDTLRRMLPMFRGAGK